MSGLVRCGRAGAVALLAAMLAGGQSRQGREPYWRAMPPEIVLPDEAPVRSTVEVDNDELRVVRIKLAAFARARNVLAERRGMLLVAVTPVDLRFASGRRDVHLGTGLTQWIDDANAPVQNLGPESCEFLVIVTKR